MIRNYLLVAIRNLRRSKFFSVINIFGLAISMTICMAIIMLVADQMMYDRFNSKQERVFRITSRPVTNDGVERGGMDNATTPMLLGEELLRNYTGIESVVRFRRGFGNNWMELEGQNVNIPLTGFFADPGALAMFEYELEHGDPSTALVQPYSVVLTRKAAKKLFKEENPVGSTLKVGDNGTYTVTGVLKETNNKSHIVFEGLASMSTIKSLQNEGQFQNIETWTDFWNTWTYILIDEEKSPDDIKAHLDKIYTTHIATIQNPETYKANFQLQSLMDITPGPLINNFIGPSLPWIVVYFLGGLAGIIMLTSCFNFTNLSIARSLTRAREIGVRKVTGAARIQIFTQFLLESVVVALFALASAFVMLWFFKPLFLQLNFARIFRWDLQANYAVYGVFLLFAIIVGMLAGFFPAVVLSGFQPIKVLKSLSSVKLFSRVGSKKVLLVVQFTLSLIFILSTIILNSQLRLFKGKDHGFAMNNNIIIHINNTPYKTLKAELLKYSNVTSVAAASHVPASGSTYGDGFKRSLDETEWTGVNWFATDEDYIKNIDLKLVAGSTFSESEKASANAIILNEEAVKAFHFKTPAKAIGEEIIYHNDSTRKTIVGVVKDYNHQILLSSIKPMALLYSPDQFNILQVRYSGDREAAVKSISKAWASVNPDLKIDLRDFEAEIKQFYDIIFGDLVNVLSVIAFLAIIISCLGLLGMATYTIETKVKEIAIRKVLGSGNSDLIILLSKGFLKLLGVAVLLGVPSALLINNAWLEMIAYRVEISIGLIAVGVMILFGLGIITIGTQTFRAASANPVDSLKND